MQDDTFVTTKQLRDILREELAIQREDIFSHMDRRFKEQHQYFQEGFEALNFKIDFVSERLEKRCDGLEQKLELHEILHHQ